MSNQTVFFFVILPAMVLITYIAYFFIVLLHELGHAIPALIFTQEDVSIYIGSKSDGSSHNLRLGKIKFYIKANYVKFGGTCYHSAVPSKFKDMIIVLAGPVGTAIVAAILLQLTFSNNLHGSMKLLFMILFVLAIISMLTNLYPRKYYSKDNGGVRYSDGYRIFQILTGKNNAANINQAAKYVGLNDPKTALKYLEKITPDYMNYGIFEWTLACYLDAKEYKGADHFIQKFLNTAITSHLNSNDYCNLGYIEIQLKRYDQAMVLMYKSLGKDSRNIGSLINVGFLENIAGNYSTAISFLNKAINVDANTAYAYSNRAFSLIKLGLLQEALDDIHKSIELDDNNSYNSLTMGMYLFENKLFAEALKHFEKALQMDPNTLHAAEYLYKTKQFLSE